MKLPNKKYGVIYADPPWHFRTFGPKGRKRSPDWKPHKDAAAQHYETMSIDDMMKLPIANIAEENCALFMWISWPMLEDALRLMSAWGFTYKTCAFSWIKANASQIDLFRDDLDGQIGLGYWTRSNGEVCLLAMRGKPKRLKKDVRQAIIEPRRQHSRKPDCVYERIERLMGDVPKIELFSRTRRKGWDMVGHQVGKFITPEPNHRGDSSSGHTQPRKKRNSK
jgi:N6-adenosine-specific RNA methylase IME4